MPTMPFVLFALFPLYFMLVTSFKKNAELYDVTSVPFWIGRGVTFGHYELLSKDTFFFFQYQLKRWMDSQYAPLSPSGLPAANSISARPMWSDCGFMSGGTG